VDAIGLEGRCSGAVLYAECSEVVGAVGGWLFRTRMGQVQSRGRENGARRGVYGVPDGCVGAAV
jgi:hypothetical protein